MRGPPVLIVHPDRKHQRLVQRILGASGYRVEVADDLERAGELVATHQPQLVVIDGAIASEPFLQTARAHGARACLTLVADTAYTAMPRVQDTRAVTNVLAHAMPVVAEELVVAAHKLVRGDLFGADKYLLWGTQLAATTITHASQRAQVIEELAQGVRARGQTNRVAHVAMLLADEFISNAVHNAPVDAAGVHYRRDVARDIEIELDDRHQVQLRWGCDARYLALEVTDHWGSLDRATILKSINTKEVRETGGGAGMGLSLAYRSCDHLVFDIAPGQRTEIIALMDLRYPPSERVMVSSYNVFVDHARQAER